MMTSAQMPTTAEAWTELLRRVFSSGFKLEEFAQSWEELRKAVDPPARVSDALRDHITTHHRIFREWLAGASAFKRVMYELANGWELLTVYRDAAWRARQEGLQFVVFPGALPLPMSPAELQAQLDAEGRPVTLDDLSNLNAPKDWKPKPWEWGNYALYIGLGLAAVFIVPPLLGSLTRRM